VNNTQPAEELALIKNFKVRFPVGLLCSALRHVYQKLAKRKETVDLSKV